MTNTQDLVARIAALRGKLDRIQSTAVEPAVIPISRAEPDHNAPPTRLTFRAAQLLKEAQAQLTELKTLASEPALRDESSACHGLQREAAGLLDVVMRNLVRLPDGAAAQLRACDGLKACLNLVRERLHLLHTCLTEQRDDERAIDTLADIIRLLVRGESVNFGALVDLARGVVDEAARNAPLRFRAPPSDDVARFAASHGLAVARVQAWTLRGEITNRQRQAELLIPALIHDAGMATLDDDLVFNAGPLDDDARRIMRGHVDASHAAAHVLCPGGGWIVEAVAHHHERADGSGYPNRRSAADLSEAARLLAACDVYAAMASPRPHRPAHDPRTALADTLNMADRGELAREQAEKLLRLTFYPAGSVVQLSDGAVALVVGTPKSLVNPSKATVIPLRSRFGTPPGYPWPIDLSESNDLSILRTLTPRERLQLLGQAFPALV
jgi:hypothetical protein